MKTKVLIVTAFALLGLPIGFATAQQSRQSQRGTSDELSQCRKELTNAKQDNKTLSDRIKALQDQSADQGRQRQACEQNLQDRNQQIQTLNQQVQSLNQQLEATRQQLTAQQNETGNFRRSLLQYRIQGGNCAVARLSASISEQPTADTPCYRVISNVSPGAAQGSYIPGNSMLFYNGNLYISQGSTRRNEAERTPTRLRTLGPLANYPIASATLYAGHPWIGSDSPNPRDPHALMIAQQTPYDSNDDGSREWESLLFMKMTDQSDEMKARVSQEHPGLLNPSITNDEDGRFVSVGCWGQD